MLPASDVRHIVLLGASGFVGRAIVRQLEAQCSETRVHALVHRTPLDNAPTRVTAFFGAMTSLPAGLFPDSPHVVIHCGSKQIDRDGKGFAENEQGIACLRKAINPYTKGILFPSSYSVYGNGPLRAVTENAALNPKTALAKSRVACEEALRALASCSPVKVIACRTRFVVGKGDSHFLPGLQRFVRSGIKLSDERQSFSIIDVDHYAIVLLELASAIFEGRAPQESFSAFNVGYQRPISLGEMRAVLQESSTLPPPRYRIPVNDVCLRALELMPLSAARRLAQRIRLLALDQYGANEKLNDFLNRTFLKFDPRQAIRAAASPVKYPE